MKRGGSRAKQWPPFIHFYIRVMSPSLVEKHGRQATKRLLLLLLLLLFLEGSIVLVLVVLLIILVLLKSVAVKFPSWMRMGEPNHSVLFRGRVAITVRLGKAKGEPVGGATTGSGVT